MNCATCKEPVVNSDAYYRFDNHVYCPPCIEDGERREWARKMAAERDQGDDQMTTPITPAKDWRQEKAMREAHDLGKTVSRRKADQ